MLCCIVVCPNSHHCVGLIDGRILYDTMHARVHPLGALRGDVTYVMMDNGDGDGLMVMILG